MLPSILQNSGWPDYRSLMGVREEAGTVPAVGLVTALPEEYAALGIVLKNLENVAVPGDPNLYARGSVVTPDGPLDVVATQLIRPGNNMAAASTAALLSSFPSI